MPQDDFTQQPQQPQRPQPQPPYYPNQETPQESAPAPTGSPLLENQAENQNSPALPAENISNKVEDPFAGLDENQNAPVSSESPTAETSPIGAEPPASSLAPQQPEQQSQLPEASQAQPEPPSAIPPSLPVNQEAESADPSSPAPLSQEPENITPASSASVPASLDSTPTSTTSTPAPTPTPAYPEPTETESSQVSANTSTEPQDSSLSAPSVQPELSPDNNLGNMAKGLEEGLAGSGEEKPRPQTTEPAVITTPAGEEEEAEVEIEEDEETPRYPSRTPLKRTSSRTPTKDGSTPQENLNNPDSDSNTTPLNPEQLGS
ncbi:hypothetical protein J7K05_00450 [bacterium]|nr:hypothetical protein [bacterium]